MPRAAEPRGIAWEPLTPHGVAMFARAAPGRLFVAQVIVAALAAVTVMWFLREGWFPVIRTALRALPPEGAIHAGRLEGPEVPPRQLAGNRFLGLALDLNHSGLLGQGAHLQVEFGRQDFRLIALLGYLPVDYPPGRSLPFNRTELVPRWGAWEPMILVIAGVGTVLALLVTWTLLATLYTIPVKLIVWLQKRELGWRQSWRLGAAALLPGALFLTFGIFAYTLGLLDLIRLAGIIVLHFLVGWVYLALSPLFLPRPAPAHGNPFQPDGGPEDPPGGGETPVPPSA